MRPAAYPIGRNLNLAYYDFAVGVHAPLCREFVHDEISPQIHSSNVGCLRGRPQANDTIIAGYQNAGPVKGSYPTTQGRNAMLVLTRRINEEIVIDGKIFIIVVEVRGEQVRLGICAPTQMRVDRQEVHERGPMEPCPECSAVGQSYAHEANALPSGRGEFPMRLMRYRQNAERDRVELESARSRGVQSGKDWSRADQVARALRATLTTRQLTYHRQVSVRGRIDHSPRPGSQLLHKTDGVSNRLGCSRGAKSTNDLRVISPVPLVAQQVSPGVHSCQPVVEESHD